MTLDAAFVSAVSALPAVGPGCVQVGLADVRDWRAWLDEAGTWLDSAERARASRQRLPHERDARTLAYAMHRLFLARALGCTAAEVPLYRDERGRPRLVGDRAWTSLSHADGWLAFAAAPAGAGPVGVDIEPVSRSGRMDEIATELCHPDEWRRLSSRPASGRASALLDTWVRKEAVLKAVGVGLAVPMASFVAARAAPVCVPGFCGRWQVLRLDAGPDAVAAVAALQGTRVVCARLRPRAVATPPSEPSDVATAS